MKVEAAREPAVTACRARDGDFGRRWLRHTQQLESPETDRLRISSKATIVTAIPAAGGGHRLQAILSAVRAQADRL